MQTNRPETAHDLNSLSSLAHMIFAQAIRGLPEGATKCLLDGEIKRITEGHYAFKHGPIEVIIWSDGEEKTVPFILEREGEAPLIAADIYESGEIEMLYSREQQAKIAQFVDGWIRAGSLSQPKMLTAAA